MKQLNFTFFAKTWSFHKKDGHYIPAKTFNEFFARVEALKFSPDTHGAYAEKCLNKVAQFYMKLVRV